MGGIYVFGDLARGKIALDQQYIYVAGVAVVRFTLGDPNWGVVIDRQERSHRREDSAKWPSVRKCTHMAWTKLQITGQSCAASH